MSRPLRIEYRGAWYHVMNRGGRSEEIFRDKKDYDRFVELVKESSDMWNVRIAPYCLMPNHYHLFVQTPDGNLSRLSVLRLIERKLRYQKTQSSSSGWKNSKLFWLTVNRRLDPGTAILSFNEMDGSLMRFRGLKNNDYLLFFALHVS